MKFGGSSVGTPERIKQCAAIVADRLDRRPVVVASAFRGVTDELLQLAHDAVSGITARLGELEARHIAAIDALGLDRSLVSPLFAELAVLVKGISLVKELTPRTLDYVASFGERLSCRILAGYLDRIGIPAEAHDAFDIGMVTDNRFGRATPLPNIEPDLRRSIERMKKLPVITGFVGKTATGDITTLGRNGSDYTATILGAAIGAEEVQLWSDVSGIMTADPRIVPEARTIDELSFAEASELAWYGGKLAHPFTIIPAVRRGIPVRALNTLDPDHAGTRIVGRLTQPRTGARAIAHKTGQIVVNVESAEMLQGVGFLSRIFDVFARHQVVVNMVSTSEVSVSITTDSVQTLDRAVGDLSREFDVSIDRHRAIVCVVGEGLGSTPGVAGEVFGALRDVHINVQMISQGASKVNLAFVVASEDVPTAVRSLHRRLFGS